MHVWGGARKVLDTNACTLVLEWGLPSSEHSEHTSEGLWEEALMSRLHGVGEQISRSCKGCRELGVGCCCRSQVRESLLDQATTVPQREELVVGRMRVDEQVPWILRRM